MKMRMMYAGGLALLSAGWAGAQTKASGTMKCSKPEPAYTIEVGDRPGHVMVLQKETCTWPTPFAIGSDQTKEVTNVATVEVTPTRASGSGISVTTTEGGDKTFSTFRYTSPMKDGKTGETKGTWTFTGGSGKLKGIKGGGTFKSTFAEDGVTTEVEGEYTLAEGGKKK